VSRFGCLAITFAIALVAAGCGGKGLGLANPFGSSGGQGSSSAEGQAHLQNEQNHAGITVTIVEINVSLITNTEGVYSLVNQLADGDWTLRAVYPYFSAQEQSFTVINGVLENSLQTMLLPEKIAFTVTTDKTSYTYGETVFVTLEAVNVTSDPVTIDSMTSPLEAFAVRFNGQTVAGGLFPGQNSEPEQVTLEPGVPQQSQWSWTIDNPDLAAGEYQIYGILTNSGQYPDYFDPNSDLAAQFNDSLFTKFTPATITLTAQ